MTASKDDEFTEPTPNLVPPLRQRTTAGWVISGIAGAALIYGLIAGLAIGATMWFWAINADNGETNSEAPTWSFIGVFAGGVVFAGLGAIAGLVQRIFDRWVRWPWVLPVLGLLIGADASDQTWLASAPGADRSMLAFAAAAGLVAGLLIHRLFGTVIVASNSAGSTI